MNRRITGVFGAAAALQRPDDGGTQRPAQLRFPDKAYIAELRPDTKIAIASRSQLAEAAVDPASLAIHQDETKVTAEFERSRRKEIETRIRLRRARP